MIKYGEVLDYRTADKALVGKKYIFGDHLKKVCEDPEHCTVGNLSKIHSGDDAYSVNGYIFMRSVKGAAYQFCREVIEEEVLMTNRQLAEWLAKGNGQKGYLKYKEAPEKGIDPSYVFETYHLSDKRVDGEPCDEDIRVRSWGSDEWVKPTVDIYERDCKEEGK